MQVGPSQPVGRSQPERNWPADARALCEAVQRACWDREPVFATVLEPGMASWSGFPAAYGHYRHLASAPAETGAKGAMHDADDGLMTLYALSRTFEYALIGLQDRAALGRADPAWPGDPPFSSPERAELLRFFGALGMAPMAARRHYHPFFHEVAAAVPDPTLGDAVLVEEELWPGLWFGDLVFARAGVRVRCGPEAPVDPALAARTTLYFAWQRVHRQTCDLSDGWGSNSQWATDFRRDYLVDGTVRYNVDGCVLLTPDTATLLPHAEPEELEGLDDLPPAERVELLVHRCFVRTHKRHEDRWPFDDTYVEPAPGPDLAL